MERRWKRRKREEGKIERKRARKRSERGRFANFLGEEKLDYEI